MKLYTGDDADDESDQSDCEVEGEMDTRAKPELGYVQHQKYRDGVLTIGCVGKVLRLLLNDTFRLNYTHGLIGWISTKNKQSTCKYLLSKVSGFHNIRWPKNNHALKFTSGIVDQTIWTGVCLFKTCYWLVSSDWLKACKLIW